MTDKQSFIIRNKRILDNAVSAVQAIQDEPVMQVIIKPYRKSKSEEQLGYLWAGVLPSICKHLADTGLDQGAHYTPDDIYEWMVDEYAETRVVTIQGKSKIAKLSASKMNTKEMATFIENIIQHAADKMGFAVPLPTIKGLICL